MIFCFDFLLLLNTEKYKKHLQKCQTELEKCVQGTSVTSCASEPVYGFSKTIEQASSSVKLRYTKEKGRYLQVCALHYSVFCASSHFQADRDLNAGDLIIHETPYAAVLLPTFYASNCQHCFNEISAPIP